MESIGINKANKVLSWITVSFLIVGMVSVIWMLGAMLGSVDFASLLDSAVMEEELLNLEKNLLENEELLMSIMIPSLLFSLSFLAVLGLSIAGLIVSIISIVKCNKYKLSKTGSILTIIGFSISLIFNIHFISIASIVLLIIGAVKMNGVTSISYENLEKIKVLKSE